jgi:ubiquinone/menaquinone biosynthesis C-methylase UbiE
MREDSQQMKFVDYNSVYTNYDFARRAGTREVALLTRLLKPLKNTSVLDIGCGTANFLLHFKHMSRLAVGLDFSLGMLKQAKSKHDRMILVNADATSMPFGSDVFNAAYCIQVLHHIHEREHFLSEIYRILKPGSIFVIQSCSHEHLETFTCYHYFPQALEIDKKRIPDILEITHLLSAAGFKKISKHLCPLDESVNDAPQDYLDKRNRDGNSSFAFLSEEEIELGCRKIQKDIKSGAADLITSTYQAKAMELGGQSYFFRAVKW